MSETCTYRYPRAALTVDCVIFGRSPSGTSLLLIQRKSEPFQGRWALPGGFVELDETLEEGARRELEEETGVKVARLEQLRAFDAVDRDPRERVISIAHYASVEQTEHAPRAADDASAVAWFPLDALPPLAFDHAQIVAAALERVK
jgi:8-oxo-dGTP diphosphatase